MVIQKGQKIREGKTYEPSNRTKSRVLNSLLQNLTGKTKQQLQNEFNRKKIRLSNISDVANYIKNLYTKQ